MFGSKKKTIDGEEALVFQIANTILREWAIAAEDCGAFDIGAIDIAPDKEYPEAFKASGYVTIGSKMARFNLMVPDADLDKDVGSTGTQMWSVLFSKIKVKGEPDTVLSLINVHRHHVTGEWRTGAVICDSVHGDSAAALEMVSRANNNPL